MAADCFRRLPSRFRLPARRKRYDAGGPPLRYRSSRTQTTPSSASRRRTSTLRNLLLRLPRNQRRHGTTQKVAGSRMSSILTKDLLRWTFSPATAPSSTHLGGPTASFRNSYVLLHRTRCLPQQPLVAQCTGPSMRQTTILRRARLTETGSLSPIREPINL
jgi:hypothetical protein